jgi:hypothetical protein
VNAEAETSDTRVLLRFLSYMFGRGKGCLPAAREVPAEGANGSENRVELVDEK